MNVKASEGQSYSYTHNIKACGGMKVCLYI